ncbi:MAG: ADP-ribosylglycohydrolase family protein, partial [Chitinispirillaceae bacterium]|nr:ADP-ribosylglycohydrolase family protein [Chitinispirillaceae bacterium]
MHRTPLYSEDKLTGLMLGMVTGDALGARFADKEPDEIPLLDVSFLNAHLPKFYTGDTQMAISVLEEMIESGQIDQSSLKDRILGRFAPWRGYGGGMLEVIDRWRGGASIAETASSLYNGTGNFGDGGAVRIAPISFFFNRNQTAELFEQVHRCVLLTHTHPYGISGAILQATMVLFALNDIPYDQWMPEIFKLPLESAFKIKLGKVVQCLENHANAHESAKSIGNGSEAIEAVPAALYAVL